MAESRALNILDYFLLHMNKILYLGQLTILYVLFSFSLILPLETTCNSRVIFNFPHHA